MTEVIHTSVRRRIHKDWRNMMRQVDDSMVDLIAGDTSELITNIAYEEMISGMNALQRLMKEAQREFLP